jgi:carboxyl-terminal processing protease
MIDPPKFSNSSPGAGPGQPVLWLVVVGVLLIVGAGGFAAGFVTANAARLTERDATFGPFYEAWDYVNQEFYYNKPAVPDRVRGAIQGLLATLKDRYTLLMEPQAAASDAAIMNGENGGIGARVLVDATGQLVISEVLFGKPAYQAGVRSGDVIISADGVDLRGSTSQAAIQKIRGEIGTTVELVVLRDNKPLTFKIMRDQINVYGRMLDNQIAYVSLSLFDNKASDQLQEMITTLLKEKPTTLIFDLRGNPGGYLDQAVKVADLFLKQGIVVREKTSAGENKTFNTQDGQVAEDIPLIVLVDRDSASAAEIVSGALKDRGRAVLIGQTTYGKGSVQSLHKLTDGSQLRVTSGAWYTPNDTPIQSVGLSVNRWVDVPEIFAPGTDPILDAAIRYAHGERLPAF